jgi:ribosomal subunit interface protein
MDMVVKGRHIDVLPDVKAYAEEKVGRVAHILNGMAMSLEVELFHERNRSIGEREVAEATLFTKGHILRARESGSDMKSAIDKVAAKLERQARRFKERVVDRHAGKGAAPAPTEQQPAGELGRGDPAARAARPRLLPLRLRAGRRDRRAVPPPRRRLRPAAVPPQLIPASHLHGSGPS